MGNPVREHWIRSTLERSGLRSLTERCQRELEQHEGAAHTLQLWKTLLLATRHSNGFPVVVGLLAIVSAGTGTYPFVPVLVAAIVFAPFRWRAIYLASALGAAAGAGLLALAVQVVGTELTSASLVRIDTLPNWLEGQGLVERFGGYALVVIAALPVPQTPVVITLALTKTSPWMIGLAVLAGKLAKYGVYVLGVQWTLKALRYQETSA